MKGHSWSLIFIFLTVISDFLFYPLYHSHRNRSLTFSMIYLKVVNVSSFFHPQLLRALLTLTFPSKALFSMFTHSCLFPPQVSLHVFVCTDLPFRMVALPVLSRVSSLVCLLCTCILLHVCVFDGQQ